MGVSEHTDPLLTALAGLSALTGDGGRPALESLRGRLQERRLRILVAGEAKRGKSTLVNALLGRDILPSGVTPLTALATTVRYGRDEGVSAVFRDGRQESLPLEALDRLVTERGNPGNRLGLASVTATVDAPLLARGVELVDTPGTGSVHAHNTAEAEAALETMDAAVFVLSADPPVSASERDLMARVSALSVTMFVVLNKADYLAGGDLAEALEFTTKVVNDATGRPARIYPVSARAGLSARGDPGFATFAAGFAGYLEDGRAADLRLSVAGHAGRMAGSLRDEVDLARRAAAMRSGEAAERVAAFAAILAAVAERRRDAADLAAGESARMLADLNEAAVRAAPELTARVRAQIGALLDGELRSAPAGQIEQAGRARLGELAVQAAESWRRQQTAVLEDGLGRLDQRLTDGLRAELALLRDAAAELLGLDLTVPEPGERLTPDLRFFYQAMEQPGQTELLAGAIRRRLPGEAGRRRARTFLYTELTDLVPQQVGRARADLQYRLAEASRRLVRDVEARYARSTGGLENALRDAAALRTATAAEAAAREAGLAKRREAIDHVLAQLDAATAALTQAVDQPGSGQAPGGRPGSGAVVTLAQD